MRRALAALTCCAVLLSACGFVSGKTVAWDNGEYRFDYPAGWTLWGPDEPISLLRPTVFAYLGTVPVDLDAICDISRTGSSCNFGDYPMEPGGVTLSLIGWQLPAQGPGDEGDAAEVGGREARFTEQLTDRGSRILQWRIDDPYSSWLVISAEIQGPGEENLRDQVEDLVASFEFTTAGDAE